MKLQKQAMGIVGGRYKSRPKFALEAIRRADGDRNRYQGALRSHLNGTWSSDQVHIADALATFAMEARQSRRCAADWMKYLE